MLKRSVYGSFDKEKIISKMSRIGFIGYGSMGSMLVNGFLTTKVIAPEDMVISTRSLAKLEAITDKWKGITVLSDNRSVAKESDVLFLCVKPLDILPVLQEIRSDLKISTHLISIAACVTIDDVANQFSGPVTKMIPSLTSEVKEGISLFCHNTKVSDDRKIFLELLLGAISNVIHIRETEFEIATDLTSCAPGLFAAIFKNFVQAGLRQTEIPPEVVHQMVVSTLFGTAKLLAQKKIGFSEMIHRVATKGGITEKGVKVLNTHLPSVFDEVFHETIAKHDSVKNMINVYQDSLVDSEDCVKSMRHP